MRSGISGAPVLGAHGEVVGVLSEADLLVNQALWPGGTGRKAERAGARRDPVLVGDACSRPAVTTDVDASLGDAAQLMLDRDVARLVVLEGAAIAGIVTRHDVLKAWDRTDFAIDADVERL